MSARRLVGRQPGETEEDFKKRVEQHLADVRKDEQKLRDARKAAERYGSTG